MMDWTALVEIIIGVFCLIGWTLGVIKYIMDKIDDKADRDEITATLIRHEEKDEREHSALWTEIRASSNKLAETVNELGHQLNSRLDTLIIAMTKKND